METLFKSFAQLESASSSSLYFEYFKWEKPSFKGEKPSSSKVVTKKEVSSTESKKWHLIHPPFISEVYTD
ncbi:hypothetical protein HNQ85_001225 [Anoxybacillus calidus]|jgi:hypothetical protein|uniref:Uncharacterized protein n=1 Tax=[Anoxybacillus] calidus TaxID=575178 RepID=A0A7W0BUY5_9BACL|nr:hypothetical protein [Anoxybacillus calidus]